MIAYIFIPLAILFILLPVIVYTFLIFPNFDGIMHNVSWYKYNGNSQNFLFWSGFWVIILFGSMSVKWSGKK